MARANFTYAIEVVRDHRCIVITEANQGQMSVTNDIENVVADIERKEELDARECIVVYQDTRGNWDGFDVKNNHLVDLGACHWAHAINRYLKMLREGTVPPAPQVF